MTDLPTPVRIGTRGSALAQAQTGEVAAMLSALYPAVQIETVIIRTVGDQRQDIPLTAFGGAGAFTSTLETALLANECDIAVHSLKDLPTATIPGLTIAAVPPRRNPADVLVTHDGRGWDDLPYGARVGTSSRRRAAQLLHARPDLNIADIRGNVDTRLRKVLEAGAYDGIVLAYAGLERLGRLDDAAEILPLDLMLPAPGQAALAVQCRDEAAWREWLRPLNHAPTEAAVTAERAFLAHLQAGCALPVAALGVVDEATHTLHLRGRVLAPEGSAVVAVETIVEATSALSDAHAAGVDLAERALGLGAARLLESVL